MMLLAYIIWVVGFIMAVSMALETLYMFYLAIKEKRLDIKEREEEKKKREDAAEQKEDCIWFTYSPDEEEE